MADCHLLKGKTFSFDIGRNSVCLLCPINQSINHISSDTHQQYLKEQNKQNQSEGNKYNNILKTKPKHDL